MRQDNPAFIEKNNRLDKAPRYVVEVSFDNAHTDLEYFTSHVGTPVPSGASVTEGVVEGITGTTQTVNPGEASSTIGALTVSLLDKDDAVSAIIHAKLHNAGEGLRHKRVRVYFGYEGLAWSDFVLVQTQIVNEFSFDAKKRVYKLRLNDAQRFMREQLFVLKETRLVQSISATDTVIPVADETVFTLVEHDAGYNDAPNQSVFYVKIDDEVIRCTGGRVDSTLGPVLDVDTNGRGALGSYAVAHEVDVSRPVDRRTAVTEYVYLEGPVPKLIYALLTGKLYGQGTATLPAHWHLGVSDEYIQLSDFENIGQDLWDTADPSAGVRARFTGLEDEDGKEFIEKELCLLAGVFMPVRTSGALGLRRFTSVLNGADVAFALSGASIIDHSDLQHAAKEVANQYMIRWNWDDVRERFTRVAFLTDTTSISKHGTAKVKRLEFRGMYGNAYTSTMLANRFNALRDRFAGPPLRLSIKTFLANNVLEVGDVVRVFLPHVRDTSNDRYVELNRAFEVQQIRIDWVKGTVTLDLFGSSEPASVSNEGLVDGTQYALLDAAYDVYSAGTDLSTVLTIDANGTVTADGTLTGASAIDPVSGAGRYYYTGNLTIPQGVTITITDNVELWVRGVLDVQGTIDGRGRGIQGATAPSNPASFNDVAAGTPGYIGTVYGTSGLSARAGPQGVTYPTYRSASYAYMFHPSMTAFVTGQNVTAPFVDIRNPDGRGLENLPSDLRGTSGSSGGVLRIYDITNDTPSITWYAGGDGGAGGAGLRIICRGMTIADTGLVDLSGGDGAPATPQSISTYYGTRTVYPGSGAGGAPGALQVFIDGALSITPSLRAPNGRALVLSEYGQSPFFMDTVNPREAALGLSGTDGVPVSYNTFSIIQGASQLDLVDYVWSSGMVVTSKEAGTSYQNNEAQAASRLIDHIGTFCVPSTPNGLAYRLVGLSNGVRVRNDVPDTLLPTYHWQWRAGTTEPVWPTTLGARVTDGDLEWECIAGVHLSGNGGGTRVQYIPKAEQPFEDPGYYAQPALGLTPVVNTNTPNTLNENLATVEVAVTPPSDSTYSYSNIYYRRQGTYAWEQGSPADLTNGTFTVPMDGTTYEVQARSVNTDGVEAPDGPVTTVNVNSGTGGVTLGNSNYLSYGKTAYSDDANVGFWLGVNSNVAQFNIGDGSNYMKWDGTSLVLAGTLTILGGSGISNLTDAGALATKDTADYAADVTGTKPPADADNTQSAVQTGLTLTGGEIRRGTDEILLDFNNRRVTVGSETYRGNGVQLEHNSGAPRAHIGNGIDKFIEFDGTNLVIGRETTIVGAETVGGVGADAVALRGADTFFGEYQSSTTDTSIVKDTSYGSINLLTYYSGTPGAFAYVHRSMSSDFFDGVTNPENLSPFFYTNARVEWLADTLISGSALLGPSNPAGSEVIVGMAFSDAGSNTYSGAWVKFVFPSSGSPSVIIGVGDTVSTGFTEVVTSFVPVFNSRSFTRNEVRIVIDSTTSPSGVDFYVNRTLIGSIASTDPNFPSDMQRRATSFYFRNNLTDSLTTTTLRVRRIGVSAALN